MAARAKWLLSSLLALLITMSVAYAQSGPARQPFAQQELDQMLAPIALYPDQLLSQILMAATYPDELAEAARWSRDNPDLNGDRAVRAAERIDWDPSVKSLVAFPQILDMMDAKLDWTEDLGDAFLDQQAQVMDTVQYLRRQAYAAGNLSSNDQFRVDMQGSDFVISYSNPEFAYVPYYDPLVIYGTWWWPANRPVYWAPWAGYRVRPGYARGYAWGPAIPVSKGFFFGAPDWRHRSVHVINASNYYYRAPGANRSYAAAPGVWQHDAARRQPAPEARHEFNRDRRATVNAQPVAANPVVPVVPATTRNEPPRNAAPRGQDSRAFEGRGETARRPDVRGESGGRSFDRGNRQIVGGMHAPAGASAPVAAAAPATDNNSHMRSMPVPTAPPAAVTHANAPAAAPEAGRRAEGHPASGREQRGHAATKSDNEVASTRGNGGEGGNARQSR